MKLDILAFGAHPDDVELSCAGTLLKHIAEGKKSGIIDLTKGERGTRGTPQTRMQEAAQAAEIIGLAVRQNLELEDAFFRQDQPTLMKVIAAIRRYRPEVVLANAPSDRHPDHGRAAALVAEACFFAGLMRIETEDEGKAQEAWRPKAIYHYVQDRYLKPDFVVDISPWMDKKMEAVKAYKSQFYDPNTAPDGPVTAISTKDFLDFLIGRAADMGRVIHARYGEGYIAARTPGVRSLFDLD